MYKTRVVKRIQPEGHVFVIQMKHPFWRWMWVDAWWVLGENVKDYFRTLEEAEMKRKIFSNLPKKRDVPVNDLIDQAIEGYDKQLSFWKRLKMFVQNVEVRDAMSDEEKDMIMSVCDKKIQDLDI